MSMRLLPKLHVALEKYCVLLHLLYLSYRVSEATQQRLWTTISKIVQPVLKGVCLCAYSKGKRYVKPWPTNFI